MARAKHPLPQLRKLCLSLPEATEKLSHGAPTFFVGGKVFVTFTDNHHNDGRIAIWCNAAPLAQDILVGADPERFFVPPYVGYRGWIGLRLDVKVDWDDVAEIVADAYRMTAPKRLLIALDAMA